MIKKPRIYLDTSILSFMWADDSPRENEITHVLFNDIKENKYEAFISAAVIGEIEAAPEPLKSKLESLVRDYDLKILEVNPEIEFLANKYIKNGIIPEKYGKDALHIATAVVNNLDAIISWNFQHIVNLRTHREANGINLLEGYRQIDIYSPWEVVEYGS